MTASDARRRAAALFLERFRWVEGHADLWSALADPPTFDAVIMALADPFRDGIDAVVTIEARGFVLAPAVAREIGARFVPIRKDGSMFPGEVVETTAEPDYRDRTQTLRLRRDLIRPDDRVLLVDDWIEVGSQARAARDLIARCEARLVAISVLVDDLDPARRGELPPVSGIVRGTDLGDDGA